MGKYKMIFTWEKEVPVDEFGEPIAYTPLQYYSDCPEDGEYEGEAEFSTLTEYEDIVKEWEGHLYQLFKGDERIGYGIFDPDSPVEEIVLAGLDCCGDCAECFWKRAYDNRYGGGDFWNKYKPTNCFVKEGMTKEDIEEMSRWLQLGGALWAEFGRLCCTYDEGVIRDMYNARYAEYKDMDVNMYLKFLARTALKKFNYSDSEIERMVEW